jgi:hypothetical protein
VHSISSQLQDLQGLANISGQRQSADRVRTTIHVLYVSGAEHPWRMVESDRNLDGGAYYSRWMFVFDVAEQLRQTLVEREIWQQADLRFQLQHMSTPGGFAGVTSDLVPTGRFDLVFGDIRESIRREICVTVPKRALRLR